MTHDLLIWELVNVTFEDRDAQRCGAPRLADLSHVLRAVTGLKVLFVEAVK